VASQKVATSHNLKAFRVQLNEDGLTLQLDKDGSFELYELGFIQAQALGRSLESMSTPHIPAEAG
jgi:hypothetical protein